LPELDNVGDTITTHSGLAALRQEELEAEEIEDICCFTCGETPCEWLEYYGVLALVAIE